VEPQIAAEVRNGLQQQLQPQMNANDADTSRRAETSMRGEVPKGFVVATREEG
jgi:hypothetical protein